MDFFSGLSDQENDTMTSASKTADTSRLPVTLGRNENLTTFVYEVGSRVTGGCGPVGPAAQSAAAASGRQPGKPKPTG